MQVKFYDTSLFCLFVRKRLAGSIVNVAVPVSSGPPAEMRISKIFFLLAKKIAALFVIVFARCENARQRFFRVFLLFV